MICVLEEFIICFLLRLYSYDIDMEQSYETGAVSEVAPYSLCFDRGSWVIRSALCREKGNHLGYSPGKRLSGVD